MFTDDFLDKISKICSLEDLLDLVSSDNFLSDLLLLADKYNIKPEYSEII